MFLVFNKFYYLCIRLRSNAPVAELADVLDLGSSAERRAGSIPVRRTKETSPNYFDSRGCFLYLFLNASKIAFMRIVFPLAVAAPSL